MADALTNLNNLPNTFRVGGSGFTVFHWAGYVIGYAQAIAVQSPKPVADPVPIQPMDQQYPMQIIVPAAIGAGTLQLQMFELYGSKVWDQIMKITDVAIDQLNAVGIYNDLSEVFLRLSGLGTGVDCTKIVYPPNLGIRGGPAVKKYADRYYNCMITDIRDDETIEIGTMQVIKSMTIMYTRSQRIGETASNTAPLISGFSGQRLL